MGENAMRCEEVRERLLELADDSATEKLRRLTEPHLRECRSCRERLTTLRREIELLRSVHVPQAPAMLWDRVETSLVLTGAAHSHARWWLTAAAVTLLAAGLGIMLPGWLTTATVQPPANGSTDATAREDVLMQRHNVLEQSVLLNEMLVTQTEQAQELLMADEEWK